MKTRTDPLAWVDDELITIRALQRERLPVHLASAPDAVIEIDGESLIHMCSNNYLGLSTHPAVVEAAIEASRRFGTGSGASRLVSGGSPVHRELEEKLAAFKGTEDAVVFSSGYLANLGTIPVLAGKGDRVLSDELNHASVVDACRLSGARIDVYRHRDLTHLSDLLTERTDGRTLVVTDTVFSMDGDAAPLAETAELCERAGAMLMVDEAHATGVLGPRGAGLVDALGLHDRVDVVMGTLSKALGSAGGYVCGSRTLISLLRNKARSYIFDTAPPPASAAAAIAALDLVEREPQRRDRALANSRRLFLELRRSGWDALEPAACVVPVLLGDEARALEVARRIRERGVFSPAIRPPSVAVGACRIRLTTMATHTDEMIDRVITAFGMP